MTEKLPQQLQRQPLLQQRQDAVLQAAHCVLRWCRLVTCVCCAWLDDVDAPLADQLLPAHGPGSEWLVLQQHAPEDDATAPCCSAS